MAIVNLKNASFKIASTDFSTQLSSAKFTPASEDSEWKGFQGAVVKDSNPADYTCAIEFGQDWTVGTGLSRYLYDHEGETVKATFTPSPATGLPTFEATITLKVGDIGGGYNGFGTASVSMPVTGKPTIKTA